MSHRDICKTCGQMYSLHDTNMHRIAELESGLTDLKAKYQKAVEALKFYADGEGEVLDWDRVNQQGCEQDRGWFARQTLAELGEKE